MAQIRNIMEMKAHGVPGHVGVSVRVKEDGRDSGLQPGPTVDPTCLRTPMYFTKTKVNEVRVQAPEP